MNNSKLRLSFIFLFLIGSMVYANAQELSLKVTYPDTGKTLVFKNNKRVKLRTSDGSKFVGKMQILDNTQVSIKGQSISLSDITKIKRSPWILSALTSGAAIYAGGALVGVGALVAVFGGPQPLLWMGAGGALIYLGVKPPAFDKNSGTARILEFEVISN